MLHFACTQENLIQNLNLVSHVVQKNTNLPVLQNILLKTEGGSLRISTTNLELAITSSVRGRVEGEGEYCVPAKLLFEYVSLLPSGKVELKQSEEGLEIQSQDQETTIKGVYASEFPVLPTPARNTPYEFQLEEIQKMIEQVVFAVSVSTSRPELTGISCSFNHQAGVAVFAATDSYRLAERTTPLMGNSEPVKCIVPSRAFLEIARILSSYKDELAMPERAQFFYTENQFVMQYGHVELISRLVDGSFPEYLPLIPTQFNTETILSRQEMQKAIRAASLFSRQGIFDIYLECDPEKQTCVIRSADQGVGKTRSLLKAQVKGGASVMMLNFRYLMDGLSAISSPHVRIQQVENTSPLLLVPEGLEEKYLYLVMPIRQ